MAATVTTKRCLAAAFLLLFSHTLSGSAQDADSGLGDQSNENEAPIVVLRALDKVTARITELAITVGTSTKFGTLDIQAQYCRSRPPIEPPETFAYLLINDEPIDREPRQVFKGWMLASSPALNPLEHPVYDVWVLACRTSSGEAFTMLDDQVPDF